MRLALVKRKGVTSILLSRNIIGRGKDLNRDRWGSDQGAIRFLTGKQGEHPGLFLTFHYEQRMCHATYSLTESSLRLRQPMPADWRRASALARKCIYHPSLLQKDVRREIERKIICARMNDKIARKHSSAGPRTILTWRYGTGDF